MRRFCAVSPCRVDLRPRRRVLPQRAGICVLSRKSLGLAALTMGAVCELRSRRPIVWASFQPAEAGPARAFLRRLDACVDTPAFFFCAGHFSFRFFLLFLFLFSIPLFFCILLVLFASFQVEGRKEGRKRVTGTPESSASRDDEIVLFSKDIPGLIPPVSSICCEE